MPDFSPVRGCRLLIALSGGADSVALMVMLSRAAKEYDLTLFAAHVDHNIRPESGDDAIFCRNLCKKLNIPFFLSRVDVPAAARSSHQGIESEARRLRYRALSDFRLRTRSDYIALAHHMDDQAETVLMHLGRGSGLRGLCGMKSISEEGHLYRPLLGLHKSELIKYLQDEGFSWREDFTNLIDDNPRNAIRLKALPALEAVYPQFVRATARCAQSIQLDNELLDELTREYLDAHSGQSAFCAWLELTPLPHRALLRRAIREKCGRDISWEQVNALEALCGQARGKVDIDPSLSVERTGARLYFVYKSHPAVKPVPLQLSGSTRSILGTITASEWMGAPIRNDPCRQALKKDVLIGAQLRSRREGDRIRPLGCGDRLLSDYLIDKKVDRPLRDAIPLIAVGNRIHWVCGYGISQQAALQSGDQAILLEYTYPLSPAP